MPTVFDAMGFARGAHEGQHRKWTNEPYLVHSFAVAGLVMSVTLDIGMIQAAFLHDVVEDTTISIKSIDSLFGSKVAKLVEELTDTTVPSDGDREKRRRLDRYRLAEVSKDAQTIKLADIIDNVKSIRLYDKEFATMYIKEKQDMLKVLTKGNTRLYKIALDLLK